jgi:hypothetical protein
MWPINDQSCCTTRNVGQHDWSCMGPLMWRVAQALLPFRMLLEMYSVGFKGFAPLCKGATTPHRFTGEGRRGGTSTHVPYITVSSCTHRNAVWTWGFIVVIKQFGVTIATNYQALTRCMKVSYVVGYERVSIILVQCIVSIVWKLIILLCGYTNCVIPYKDTCLQFEYLCVIFVGDRVKRRPRHVVR